jgi:hypothetical protein
VLQQFCTGSIVLCVPGCNCTGSTRLDEYWVLPVIRLQYLTSTGFYMYWVSSTWRVPGSTCNPSPVPGSTCTGSPVLDEYRVLPVLDLLGLQCSVSCELCPCVMFSITIGPRFPYQYRRSTGAAVRSGRVYRSSTAGLLTAGREGDSSRTS